MEEVPGPVLRLSGLGLLWLEPKLSSPGADTVLVPGSKWERSGVRIKIGILAPPFVGLPWRLRW